MKNRTYKIALFAILGAVALVLNFLEGLIPVSAFMPPGAKAGFSNIATMLAASTLGIVPALAITLIKAHQKICYCDHNRNAYPCTIPELLRKSVLNFRNDFPEYR